MYQEVDGVRREVSGGYVLKGTHQVSFQVAAYDASRPLVIDPVLFYSTYLGGSGIEHGYGVAVDTAGNAFVTGDTSSADFPTTPGAFQTTIIPAIAFVTKLNPTGSALVYSTFLGGSGTSDIGIGIAVDAAGDAYVTGFTNSSDFPTTPGAFQTAYGGGARDTFVTKLNPTGSGLMYSTHLGSGDSTGNAIAVDAAGNAYVAGRAFFSGFPTTSGAFQTGFSGAAYAPYVTKLNPTGSGLVYSTLLGGSSNGSSPRDQAFAIALDSAGDAYVSGISNSTTFPTTPGSFQTTFGGGIRDAFVTKLNPIGSGLVYSTYLGGNDDDDGFGIAVDSSGSAYVTGFTASTNFPTTPGAFQTTDPSSINLHAFVTKFNPVGSAPLVYSTYLGGNGSDSGQGVAVDSVGNAYVTGYTTSTNFPTVNAIQPALGGGSDAFVTKVNPLGTGLVYSTYLGGSGNDNGFGIALDTLPNPNAYVAGDTGSTNFPTTPGAFQSTDPSSGNAHTFVAKITEFQPDAPITAKGTTFGATEGVTFTGTVATFADPDPASTVAEYSATIDWGDATSTTPGTISGPPGGPFTVSGTHMYAEEGSYNVTVTIIDVDNSKNSATVTSTANVSDAPLVSKCATTPVSTQTYNGPTAIFTDQSSTGTLSDFSATISWGDSSSSPGTITGGPGNAPYTVSGTHTYASTGTFSITTTIKDVGGSTTTSTCSVIIFAFATGNGAAFVIGDLEAGLGNHVTWWSSQWANINLMSGGAPPNAMKGFAGFEDNFLGLPPPNCGGSWSTDTGNSTPPPPSVPNLMGVIVSSMVTQSGSIINGNIKQVVVVRNDRGYAPDPGHTGTGTEVAIVCMTR
jgi:hypothetical protein